MLCLFGIQICDHAGRTLANPRGDLLRLAGFHTLARQPQWQFCLAHFGAKRIRGKEVLLHKVT